MSRRAGGNSSDICCIASSFGLSVKVGVQTLVSEWYVKSESGELGPYSAPEIRQFAATGRITSSTPIRNGRQGLWTAAGRVSGLMVQLPQATRGNISHTPPPLRKSRTDLQQPVSDVPQRKTNLLQGQVALVVQKKFLVIGGGILGGVMLIAVAVTMLSGRGGEAPEGGTRKVAAASESPVASVPDDGAARKLTSEQIVAQADASVACVRGRFGGGTGFLVRPGIVATNRHVIGLEFIDDIQIRFPSAAANMQGPYSVELQYEDPDLDLAFLAVASSLSPLKTAPDYSFRRGQEILVIGSPDIGNSSSGSFVLQNAVSRGVMSTQAIIDGQEFYQLGMSVNPGNSGGPVLDQQGRVLGVVTSKATAAEGVAFCIPLGKVMSSLNRMDGLSPKEVVAIRVKHRLRTVFIFIAVDSELHKTGMQAYASAMESALNNGLSVNVGLEAVKSEVEARLPARDAVLLARLEQEISRIAVDPEVTEGTRQLFVDFWTNYIELKSYVQEPRGNFETYRAKYNELADVHDRLVQSLKLLLGV